MTTVLHLRASSGLYGADRALLALAQHSPASWAPVVASIVRDGCDDALTQEARSRGIAACSFRSNGKLDARLVGELSALMKQQPVALIHAHDYKSLSLALLARAATRVPVVATFHGDTGATAALWAYERFARLLGNACAGIAAVSRPLLRTLRAWAPLTRTVHIPNGVELPALPSLEDRARARVELRCAPSDFVVAVIGRLSVEKGHRLLIDALRMMRQPPRVLLAGEGPERARLAGPVRFLPVEMLGYQSNTSRIYAAADCVVIPSRTEGLPLVALEAMSRMRPVIATAVGELPILLGEEAGVIVPAQDAGALAHAMEQLRSDASLRETTAARGLARVRQSYSIDATAKRYHELLYLPALGTVPSAMPVRA